jgi:hypothetical protein
MALESNIRNLEIRLEMAVAHAIQAQDDLNSIRLKAGLPAAKSMFNLDKQAEKPPAGVADRDGWWNSPDRRAWREQRPAKFRPAAEAAQPKITQAQGDAICALITNRPPPSISPEVWAVLAERGRRERGEPDPEAPIDPVATARAIARAAAVARGELIELPPAGSQARAILESAAKRRNEYLSGRPL